MSNKENLLKNALAEFDKYDGGSKVDAKSISKKPENIKAKLQESFDVIFPELMKREKHRKHVIFDGDVFEMFEGLSKTTNSNFSALINSALREYARKKFASLNENKDPVEELLELRRRSEELSRKIKNSNLDIDLKRLLG